MIFEFETTGENKVLATSDRVAASLQKVKQGYAQVSKELGAVKKAMQFANSSGIVGGVVGANLASIGRSTAEEKKQLTALGEAGSQAGVFAGAAVGASIGGSIAGKVIGAGMGRILGAVGNFVFPVVGAIVGTIIGESLGGIVGDMVSDLLGFDRNINTEAYDKGNAVSVRAGGSADRAAIDSNFRFWAFRTGESQVNDIRAAGAAAAQKQSEAARRQRQDNAEAMRILMRI